MSAQTAAVCELLRKEICRCNQRIDTIKTILSAICPASNDSARDLLVRRRMQWEEYRTSLNDTRHRRPELDKIWPTTGQEI